ncbi:hypothetical protein ONZ45_g8080 [Pleurotus djamor]|nr:hypothetical protein ONZ45_g8080 [Pleurotus djamor]
MLKIFSLLSFALLTLSEEITITGVHITISPTPTITHPPPIPVPNVSLSYLGAGSDGTVTFAALYSFASMTSPFTYPGHTLQATYFAGSTQLVFSAMGYGVEIRESHTSTYATETGGQACSWGEERIQGTCVYEVNGTPEVTFYGVNVQAGDNANDGF